ncbi:hypothetical protein H0H92_001756 [Tricholoma furcatifolium]|nr:hypothetical protein H0H92_001756 [Tricholoma furcatifolium]
MTSTSDSNAVGRILDNCDSEYWLSYEGSRRYSSLTELGCESATIAIVLEREARRRFLGIRLLIVRNLAGHGAGGGSMDNIQSSLEANFETLSGASTLRQQLFSRQQQRKNNINVDSNGQPWCTLVFELCQLSLTSTLYLTLRPHPIVNASERLSVIQELKHPLPTLYARFSIWGQPWPFAMPDTIHRIRVLPIPSLRKSPCAIIDIPEKIIVDIIRHALGNRERGWRAELMCYGTVCRAWRPALDLFFESAYSFYSTDRPSAYYVARAFEQRPDRRKLLPSFVPTAYKEYYNNNRYLAFSQSCVRILDLSQALTNVHLPILADSVWALLVRVLQRLQHVKRCTLSPQTVHRPSALVKTYSINEVQTIVGGWKHLRILRCEGWTAAEASPNDIPPQLYHLKELRLLSGSLSGSQLFNFVPILSPASLKKLHLISVCGLTNSDMFSILCTIAPTLRELHVQNTPLPRATDEPYAIDATISNMPHIKVLTLAGDYVSALAIGHKPRSLKSDGKDVNQLHGAITLVLYNEFEVVNVQTVVRALETTGWKHVSVWWNRKIAWNQDTAWDDNKFLQAASKIQGKGVHLRLRFFDKSVRMTPKVLEYKPGWSPLLLELY